MLGKIWNEIRSNHIAMMAVCCMLPVILIIVLQAFGFRGWPIYAVAIFACIGSHIAMAFLGPKEGKACH